MTSLAKQSSNNRAQLVLQFVMIVVATIIAYSPALNGGFIWDDDRYLTNNPLLTAPDGLRRIWFSLDSPSQYFPLTYTSFKIERAFWGLQPFGYHLTNIFIHIANALLLWRLLARLNLPGAWLAAGIFALHPVQVESVAWITERKNLLMGFFFLLTLLAWIAFIDERTTHRRRAYMFALAFYALALCSKATACTLPAALLLILWLQKKAINRERLIQITPFVWMGFLMGLIVTWWERHHQGTQGPEFAIALPERLLIASHAIWFYAGKLIWPSNLTFSYPRWHIDPGDPLAYGWLIGLVGIFAVIFFARRIVGRGPEVALAFFIATLGPLLGFLMLYTFRYSFVADHYQYIASIGLIALFAAALSILLSRLRSRWHLEIASAALLFLVLGGLTWQQSKVYRNVETLWSDTLAKNPDSWLAHNNLGAELLHKGQVDDAMMHFQKSLAIKPDHAEAENNLGNVFLRKGQFDDAVAHYQKALEIKPDYASPHTNLGNVSLRRGELNESVAQYEKAIAIKPDLAEPYNNLGFAQRQQGKIEEAVRNYRKALALKPEYAEAHYNLGEALLQLGQRDEAIAHLTETLRIKPDDADAKRELEKIGATRLK